MRFPVLLAALSLAACAQAPTASDSTALSAAKVGAPLQEVRAAMARFSSFEQAKQANYTYLFGDACFAEPLGQGAMGYHYVNTALLDATVDEMAPEAVMYEPQANGTLKLVGLEYVVPRVAWTDAAPPRLFGQDYSYNPVFDLFTLHVWLYQENPAGMFVGWNSTVSCANAPAALLKEHHH